MRKSPDDEFSFAKTPPPQSIKRVCDRCEELFIIYGFNSLEKNHQPIPNLCQECERRYAWKQSRMELEKSFK